MKTVILHTDTDPDYAQRASQVLKNGGLVAIPTETVYGLAANALDEKAVEKIYLAKGRPSDNPLIVHISSFAEWEPLVQTIPEKAKKIADTFWPGPLTIILPKSDLVPNRTSGNLATVAVRMPAHPAARAIIAASGLPLAAPSANISGFPSPTKAEYVIDDMNGRIDMIVDGGDSAVGVESTVITFAGDMPEILRPGGITPEQIEGVIGKIRINSAVLHPLQSGEKAESPGMKYKHYAPKAQITIYTGSKKGYFRLLEEKKAEGVYALCFQEDQASCPVPCVTMGSEKDPLSQAVRLFDALRELDEQGAQKVLARCPDETGVGLAVCNRLFRAAAFRFFYEAPILGLTGESGAGKSTVAAFFANNGFAVVDCDQIARQVAEKEEIQKQLAEAFGQDICQNGGLNRRLLAQRAFSSEEKTALLNQITHPAILRQTIEQALTFSRSGKPVVIDAPLLFSTGLDKFCDWTIAVTADEKTRLLRIMERDSISMEDAKKRTARQQKENFAERADQLVCNDDNTNYRNDLMSLIERIRSFDEKNKTRLP